MDCLRAQGLVSATLDREPVPEDELAAAKEHCRVCPDCAPFVRSLVLQRRAAVPQPPAELADRIVSAVRAEHDRAQRAAVSIAAHARSAADEVGSDAQPAPSDASVWAKLRDRRHRTAVLSWAAAAAVVFVAAGFGAVAGVRSILDVDSSPEMVFTSPEGDAQTAQTLESGSALKAQAPAADTAARSVSAAASVGLIVIDGAVYRSVGEDTSVSESSLAEVGRARSSLDAEGTARDWTVLGTDDPARVFIVSEGDRMLAFDRVTTSFQGRTYVLQSAPIDHFGELASLPDSVPEPASSTGSPVFVIVEEGISPPVYMRESGDADDGIAYPPGAQSSFADGWSWWTPADL